MRNYEKLSTEDNIRVNEILNKLESDWYVKQTTHKERQYSFLVSLQNLHLRSDLVFYIYTNTDLK